MREHMGLFRGKRKDNGEWVEGAFCPKSSRTIFGKPEDIPSIIKLNDPYSGFWFEVDPDTVGECTGLRDKNGKLAFEHHITVDQWGRRWVIFGCAGGFGICRNTEWTRNADCVGRLYNALAETQNAFWFSESHKIIGDIHDNPELLKGGGSNDA